MTTANEIIARHLEQIGRTSEPRSWEREHCYAFVTPRADGEKAIVSLIRSLAHMCDASAQLGINIADDDYFGDSFEALISVARGYLNFDCGRLDCGSLDRLILQIATLGGYNVDE